MLRGLGQEGPRPSPGSLRLVPNPGTWAGSTQVPGLKEGGQASASLQARVSLPSLSGGRRTLQSIWRFLSS